MRILHEDHNRVTFQVYPDKSYILGLIFIIAVMAYSLIYLSRDNIK